MSTTTNLVSSSNKQNLRLTDTKEELSPVSQIAINVLSSENSTPLNTNLSNSVELVSLKPEPTNVGCQIFKSVTDISINEEGKMVIQGMIEVDGIPTASEITIDEINSLDPDETHTGYLINKKVVIPANTELASLKELLSFFAQTFKENAESVVPFRRQGFERVATIVTAATIAHAVIDRLINNHTPLLGPRSSAVGVPLLLNVNFFVFINNMVKALWKEVSSNKEQLAVLVAFFAMSLAIDASASPISPKDGTFSQTTASAALIMLGYMIKMFAYESLAMKAYKSDSLVILENINMVARRGLSGAFLSGVTTGASIIYEILPQNDPTATSTGMTYSSGFSKISKSLVKSFKTKKERIAACMGCLTTAVASSLVVGLSFPAQQVKGALPWLRHYFGPTSAIALSGVSTNVIIKALDKSEDKVRKIDKIIIEYLGGGQGIPFPDTTEMLLSKALGNKQIIPLSKKDKKRNIATFSAVTVAAQGAHALNEYLGWGKTIDLGIKLCNYGWDFAALRNLVKKGAHTVKDKAVYLLAAAVFAVVVEAFPKAVKSINAAVHEDTDHSKVLGNMLVLTMTLATALALGTKLVRNSAPLLPKEGHGH